MASADDQNPFRHAPKGETKDGRDKRLSKYYSWQRNQAEQGAAQGNQQAAGRASQIYGKLVAQDEDTAAKYGTRPVPGGSRDLQADAEKQNQYGAQSLLPGAAGQMLGNAATGVNAAVQGGQTLPIGELAKAAGPIISRIAQAVGMATKAGQQQRPQQGPQSQGQGLMRPAQPGQRAGAGAIRPGARTPQPGRVVGNQQGPMRPDQASANALPSGRPALTGGRPAAANPNDMALSPRPRPGNKPPTPNKPAALKPGKKTGEEMRRSARSRKANAAKGTKNKKPIAQGTRPSKPVFKDDLVAGKRPTGNKASRPSAKKSSSTKPPKKKKSSS